LDFSISPDLEDLRQRTVHFIRDKIIPLERDPRQFQPQASEEFRLSLNRLARAEGLLAPHVGTEWGGLGLDHRAKAIVFEAAGYSVLGPLAMHISAPDEGNMHLLEQIATPAQKQRWLARMASGEIRTCFAMTEPHPGAGSDPSMLQTSARRVGDHYEISGRKWLITGADGAKACIVMARDEEQGGNASMFLIPMESAGLKIERIIDTLDEGFAGGHAVLTFDSVRAELSDLLGEAGQGFRYAQIRLAPARLTHCMRWLGAAQRAHDIAVDYARTRQAFGKRLGEHEGIGFFLADNLMDLHQARLVIAHTAWVLDQGGKAREESSMAKVICSEAIWRVVDRSLQTLGGLGITSDVVVSRIMREARAFRIYDGPSEVHRWSLARTALKQEPRG